MSYTPTEWKNGDIITAEKMNNIESGISNVNNVAVVKIIVNPDFPTSMTWECYIGYAEGMTPYNTLSINTAVMPWTFSGYNANPYLIVPLPKDDDKAVIMFDVGWWDGYRKTATGDISETPETGCIRYDSQSWESGDYDCFIVEGDGTITLQYED